MTNAKQTPPDEKWEATDLNDIWTEQLEDGLWIAGVTECYTGRDAFMSKRHETEEVAREEVQAWIRSLIPNQDKVEAPTLDNKPRGFPGLPCLCCGETDCVVVSLAEIEFRCNECEAVLGREEAAEAVQKWCDVLAWVQMAPITE